MIHRRLDEFFRPLPIEIAPLDVQIDHSKQTDDFQIQISGDLSSLLFIDDQGEVLFFRQSDSFALSGIEQMLQRPEKLTLFRGGDLETIRQLRISPEGQLPIDRLGEIDFLEKVFDKFSSLEIIS